MRQGGQVHLAGQGQMPEGEMVKKYKLRYGEFSIEYGGLCGYCTMPDRLMDYPHWGEDFSIWLDDRLKGKAKLDTLIHELLHAEHPELTEEQVTETATHLAEVLHGEGWREKTKGK